MTARILLVPSRLDIEAFGAKERFVSVGTRIKLAPHCDLWAQGAHYAVVRRIDGDEQSGFTLRVRPEVMGKPVGGKLRRIQTHHVDLTE